MSNDELERRIAAVERLLPKVSRDAERAREDAAAARTLASHADRDVADFRETLTAHGRLLNALRDTQIEQGIAIAELRSGVDGLRAGFGRMESGMAHLTRLIEGLVARGDDGAPDEMG